MASLHIAIVGCGSLGSQIAQLLAKENVRLYLIDDDKVEPNNIYVSVYSNSQIAQSKAFALAKIAEDRGAEVVPMNATLSSVKQLTNLDVDLVVDCLDNLEARNITGQTGMTTLHVGVGKEENGVVLWDDAYPMKPATYRRGEEPNPVCTNALGAKILRRTALRAAEVIEHWAQTGQKINALTNGGVE